jgi:hypothetical protein
MKVMSKANTGSVDGWKAKQLAKLKKVEKEFC